MYTVRIHSISNLQLSYGDVLWLIVNNKEDLNVKVINPGDEVMAIYGTVLLEKAQISIGLREILSKGKITANFSTCFFSF